MRGAIGRPHGGEAPRRGQQIPDEAVKMETVEIMDLTVHQQEEQAPDTARLQQCLPRHMQAGDQNKHVID